MTTTPTAGEMASTLRRLWKGAGAAQVYVIVDAAINYAPVVLLREQFNLSPRTLFQGEAAAALADVAPYVCPVEISGEFLDMWCGFWGTNQGVLLSSTADLETLQRHLREIFVVQDDEGQEYFFRYYDPRVIRPYLPTCTPDELHEFQGPITSWCVEGEDPRQALVLQPGNEGIVSTEIPLAEATVTRP